MSQKRWRDIMANMGKHRAGEGHDTWIKTESVRGEKRTGKIKAILVYCQPFYKRYRKTIVSALGVALSAGIAAYTDGVISHDEWYFIGTQVLATFGVYQIPNATNKKVVKSDNIKMQ